MDFELIEEIRDIQPIVLGRGIRGLARLRKRYGRGRWRKLKGVARVRLIDAQFIPLRYIGTKLTESDERNSK